MHFEYISEAPTCIGMCICGMSQHTTSEQLVPFSLAVEGSHSGHYETELGLQSPRWLSQMNF